MAEYIEREAVLKFIENGLNNPDKLKAFGHDAVEIMAEIQYMPAADVAPVVHGRWVNERMIVGGFAEKWGCDCSVCGHTQQEPLWKPNYCPNCGARMDGEG